MPSAAKRFAEKLSALATPAQQAKYHRIFRGAMERNDDRFLGVRMGDVFELSKQYADMALDELELLLESPWHEVRVGALKIMGRQAAAKKAPPDRAKDLFELYLRRIDRIDYWDLVDVACIDVIGRYLADRPKDVLYPLARSDNMWERRTAIVSTAWFIRQGHVDDAFEIAEILVADDEDLVRKAVGWMLREAGKKDRGRLIDFLDRHAATMPRVALRYAIEHLDSADREHYRGLARTS